MGVAVDFKYVAEKGGFGLLGLLFGLLSRSVGVLPCVLGCGMKAREKAFCVFAYLPKDAVQASIGGIALSMGLSCGGTVLAIAALAIAITGPIGGLLIDITGKKWLSRTSLDTETVNQTNKNRHKYCLCSVSSL